MEPKVTLLPCPECGSSDVNNVLISTHPYCNTCGFWAPANWGSKEESYERWNQLSTLRHGLRSQIPDWGKDLQDRVTALENRQKLQIVQKMDPPKPDK